MCIFSYLNIKLKNQNIKSFFDFIFKVFLEIKMDECKTSESKYNYNDEMICSHKKTTSSSILYVIAVISNPARFARRYELFIEFCERMKDEKYVTLITVELQQGCRDFVTNSTIKLRTEHEIWYKENLINIAVTHLPGLDRC
jgi:hypothetical protein